MATNTQAQAHLLQYHIEDGCAILTLALQDKPSNMITQELMDALEARVQEAAQDQAVQGLIFTSNKRDFMVGADLGWLEQIQSAEEGYQLSSQLNRLMRQIETCGKPVVAAINGHCLGGGYELALACHYRIAVDDPAIKIGLPEVSAGVMPGGGGTQRLPRLVGLQKGLTYVVNSKQVNPARAQKEGLIDQTVGNQHELLPAAKQWLQNKGETEQPWDRKGFRIPGGGVHTAMGGQIMSGAIAKLREQTWGNYPNAYYAMSAVYEGLVVPFERALDVEARYFAKVVTTPEAKHMIRTLFFSANKLKKAPSRPQATPQQSFEKVGILGAGMMGAGIAYVTASSGVPAVVKDVSTDAAENASAYARERLLKRQEKGEITEKEQTYIQGRVFPTTQASELEGADLIIEAVNEARDLKAQVTQEAEPLLKEGGVFASNTSSLPITELAQASQRPENFIGLHFFSPVEKMRLVEVIRGEQTSDHALAKALDFVKLLGKTPIVVRDSRSFFTTRVFATYVREGMAMLEEGVPPALIEHAGQAAGMPMGPLALADAVSLQLLYNIVKQTELATGDFVRDASARVGRLMVDELGREGKHHGGGFYDYPADGSKHLWPGLREQFPLSDEHPPYEELQQRLLCIQSLEAARCLQEGIIDSAEAADVASVLGWGFAPYSGGVLSYINYVGAAEFYACCQEFERRFGERFRPTNSVYEIAGAG
jgi:3-hydroxyacyl-CoA dehydrogenase/enoyl-CoA hydratase/3-hydroxybutyryl-CoA epimerase